MEKVSIITPLYNAEMYILATAQSVLNQSYTNWEWIVVNDCSSDNSVKLVESLASCDPRIKLIHNSTNLKTAQTRNKGIREASGRFICFLDSDDLWHPEKLKNQVEFMLKNDYEFTFHAYKKFRESFENRGATIPVPDCVDYRDLLKTNSIACLSAMYDAKKLGKVYMPDGYKAREDYLCWLSILKRGYRAYGFNKPLGFYRILPRSYSANKLEAARNQWLLYRNHEKLNLVDCCINFSFYALNGFIKYSVI